VYSPPVDNTDAKTLLGAIDYSWLFAYAVAMFIRYRNTLITNYMYIWGNPVYCVYYVNMPTVDR